MDPSGLILVFLAFVISLVSVKLFIGYHVRKGIADVNYTRKDEKKITLAGGFGLIIPLWIFSISFIYFFGFIFEIMSICILVTIFTIIGYIDDRNPKYSKKALGWKVRALPLAITALVFAYLFSFEPIFLWVIPLALFVAGFSSLINTFEGLNGWGVGTGNIILFFITIYLFVIANPLAMYCLVLAAIVLGLTMFNKYPARTLPGDSGTLFVGSSIVGITLAVQNLELLIFVMLCFIPNIIDFFILKMISNPKNTSQSGSKPYKILADGKLGVPKGKVTIDFAKLIIKIFGPLREGQIVAIIWTIVVINCGFWLWILLLF
jgi:UDP-N-acetylglucosamine--dolichyl-phosphate N-acetylglucosaminephosphotransferase